MPITIEYTKTTRSHSRATSPAPHTTSTTSYPYYQPPAASYYPPPSIPTYTYPTTTASSHSTSYTSTTTYSPAVHLTQNTTTSPLISIDKLASKIAEEVVKKKDEKPALVRKNTDDFSILYGHKKPESAAEIQRRLDWEAKQEEYLKAVAVRNVAARNREEDERNRQAVELAELRARAAAEEVRAEERERERRRRERRRRERSRSRSRASRYSDSGSDEEREPRRVLLLEERPVSVRYETAPAAIMPAPVCGECGVLGHWSGECAGRYLRVEGGRRRRSRSVGTGSSYSRSTTSIYYS